MAIKGCIQSANAGENKRQSLIFWHPIMPAY
jgi:hypothetical protein